MAAPCQPTGPAPPPPRPAVKLSLAEVVEAALPGYRRSHVLLPQQGKVLGAIMACRTPALGAHCYQCADCGREHVQLHSCRNRHCPRCQASLAAAWLEKQEETLLPIHYFHMVFTLPHLLNPLIRQNRKIIYKLLFDCASQTLLEFGERRWGGQLGLTAVLHTWGQNLNDHYHLHCLVTGGAFNAEYSEWKGAPAHYLFSVRALSAMFRGKFCAGLEALSKNNALEFHGALCELNKPESFEKLLRQAARTQWVVYSRRPFAGPSQVLRYLSLYTHRIAISERRLLSLDRLENKVSFSYKDYADHARRKTMSLDTEEFLRRLLLHILPERFVKIRHYGILGNHKRTARLEHIRSLLEPAGGTVPPAPLAINKMVLLLALWQLQKDIPAPVVCPYCGSQRMNLTRILPGKSHSVPLTLDSS